MNKGRLEAFSDGVLAIIITIMVLELKVPRGDKLEDLKPMLPVFLSYLLSFIYVGIYWNNHHHTFHRVSKVNGAILWFNLLLLFCLSLVPFSTAWMGENHYSTLPVVTYGVSLLLPAIAYTFLITALIGSEGKGSKFSRSIGNDFKGKVSIALYITGILLAFVRPYLGIACYVAVALIWFIPDKRMERVSEDT